MEWVSDWWCIPHSDGPDEIECPCDFDNECERCRGCGFLTPDDYDQIYREDHE
jgi:hypothetical protein